MKKFFALFVMAVLGVMGTVQNALAAIELPDLPVTDLETAIGTLLAFVAVMALGSGLIRLFRKI